MARILALKFAGLGTSDGHYRLASGVPDFDVDDLYRDVARSWPSAITTRVDWQQGAVTVGGFTINLLPTLEMQSWLSRPDHARVATLDTPCSKTTTTLVFSETNLAGLAITDGRECIIVGSHSGAGIYTGCTRGALSTRATEHGQGDYLDTDIFLAVASPIRSRTVELIVVDSKAASYSAETVVFRGILKAKPKWYADIRGKGPRLSLTVDSAIEALRRSKLCVGLWTGVAGDFPGFDAETPVRWEAQDGSLPAHDSAEDRAIIADGDGAAVCSVRSTGVDVVGATLFAGASSVPTSPVAHQMFSTAEGAPAVNDAGDTLSQHPCDLVLQLLTTTPDGGNGSYDLGVSPLGIGVPAALIDVTAIEALKALLGGLTLDNLHFPAQAETLDPWDFINARVLRPFGLLLLPGEEAKLTIARLQDTGDLEAPHLYSTSAGGHLVDIYSANPEGTKGVERLDVSYGDRPGLGPLPLEAIDVFNSERELAGTNLSTSLDAGGLSLDAALEASSQWNMRFHAPIPDLVVETLGTFDVWPGEEIRVTAPGVPGRGGVHGISDETHTVIAKSPGLRDGTIRYDLLWTGAAYLRRGAIAPGARVASNAAGVATVENAAFLPGGSDAGVFESILDDGGSSIDCQLLSGTLTYIDDITITAASGAGNTLTWTGATAPVLGNVIRLTDYGSETDNDTDDVVKARYVFLANNASPPTCDGDDAYEWTS